MNAREPVRARRDHGDQGDERLVEVDLEVDRAEPGRAETEEPRSTRRAVPAAIAASTSVSRGEVRPRSAIASMPSEAMASGCQNRAAAEWVPPIKGEKCASAGKVGGVGGARPGGLEGHPVSGGGRGASGVGEAVGRGLGPDGRAAPASRQESGGRQLRTRTMAVFTSTCSWAPRLSLQKRLAAGRIFPRRDAPQVRPGRVVEWASGSTEAEP